MKIVQSSLNMQSESRATSSVTWRAQPEPPRPTLGSNTTSFQQLLAQNMSAPPGADSAARVEWTPQPFSLPALRAGLFVPDSLSDQQGQWLSRGDSFSKLLQQPTGVRTILLGKLFGNLSFAQVIIAPLQGQWQAALADFDIAWQGALGQDGADSLLWRQPLLSFHLEQYHSFSASGEVVCEDGRQLKVDLCTEQQEVQDVEVFSLRRSLPPLVDPLVLDLDGQGINFSVSASFDFDLDSDGTKEQFCCLGEGSCFLAYDRNKDGLINNGSELFGATSGNGFLELAEFDLDGNNWIDENDLIFNDLSLLGWDENGILQQSSLLASDVGAIALSHEAGSFSHHSDDGALQGVLRSSGLFLHESGGVGTVQQIDLAEQGGEQA